MPRKPRRCGDLSSRQTEAIFLYPMFEIASNVESSIVGSTSPSAVTS
jgi:hypothetical protein